LVTETTNQKATEQKEADPQNAHVHELRFSLAPRISSTFDISQNQEKPKRHITQLRRWRESGCIQEKKEIKDIGVADWQ
jgi:hypothetical protein